MSVVYFSKGVPGVYGDSFNVPLSDMLHDGLIIPKVRTEDFNSLYHFMKYASMWNGETNHYNAEEMNDHYSPDEEWWRFECDIRYREFITRILTSKGFTIL